MLQRFNSRDSESKMKLELIKTHIHVIFNLYLPIKPRKLVKNKDYKIQKDNVIVIKKGKYQFNYIGR
jgi:hypothetical protein